MTSLSFSQNGYPKWIVYQSDTLVAITEQHLDNINIVKVERDACYDAMWETNMFIDSLEVTIDGYENVIRLQQQLVTQQDSLIADMDKEIKDSKESFWKKIAGGSIALNALLILILL